jgi:hypothetical protein
MRSTTGAKKKKKTYNWKRTAVQRGLEPGNREIAIVRNRS